MNDRSVSSLLTILDLVGSEAALERPPAQRPPRRSGQNADELAVQESVRSDLARLFNSRRPPWPIPDRLALVQGAVRAHGMPDLGALALSQRSSQRVYREEMQRTIQGAEPRLRDVRVQEDRRSSSDRMATGREEGVLSVQVVADLAFGDAGPPLRYQSRLTDVAGRFDVTRGRS